jgi:hypothetical protein
LYVARHEAAAHVRPYDLDGAPLSAGFALRSLDGKNSTIAALDVDPDHQVWVADAAHERVRRFTLFGREVAGFASAQEASRDARGSLAQLVDLEVSDRGKSLECVIACGGWRRHAVQLLDEDGRVLASLRSEGDPRANFHGVTRVARAGARIYVCEAHAGRCQIFRDGEFEFLFKVPMASGQRFEPTAIAAFDDGRMVVAHAGESSALLLLDRGGRIERVLAESGCETGAVDEPTDVVIEQGVDASAARIAVIDRGGERVQVFRLSGACSGAFARAPGESI